MLSDMDKPYGLVALPNGCAQGIKIMFISIFHNVEKLKLRRWIPQTFNILIELSIFQWKVRAKTDKALEEMIVRAIRCVCLMEWDRTYAYVEMMTGIVTCRMDAEDVGRLKTENAEQKLY